MVKLLVQHQPVSANRCYYYDKKSSRVRCTPALRRYRDSIQRQYRALLSQDEADHFERQVYTKYDKICARFKLCPRDNRRRDLDNILKSTLDGLVDAGVFPDDSQVVQLEAKKCECKSCPATLTLWIHAL